MSHPQLSKGSIFDGFSELESGVLQTGEAAGLVTDGGHIESEPVSPSLKQVLEELSGREHEVLQDLSSPPQVCPEPLPYRKLVNSSQSTTQEPPETVGKAEKEVTKSGPFPGNFKQAERHNLYNGTDAFPEQVRRILGQTRGFVLVLQIEVATEEKFNKLVEAMKNRLQSLLKNLTKNYRQGLLTCPLQAHPKCHREVSRDSSHWQQFPGNDALACVHNFLHLLLTPIYP